MRRSIPARGWRKVALSTWGHPPDPQIYGDVEVDAGAILAFIDDERRRTGVKLTVTHVVGKGVANAFATCPDLNGRLRRGRFVPEPTVDVFFIVSTGGGGDLSGVKVCEADKKPAAEVATEVAARVERIRAGGDPEFGRSKGLMDRLPRWILHPVLRILAWLTGDLGLDLRALGLPRRPFGTAMVSSVGMFGISHAYAPLSPIYRVPLIVLAGEVVDRPVAVDGRVVVRPTLKLGVTLDHRWVDGFHAARLARGLTAYLADPAAFEPRARPKPVAAESFVH